MSQTITGLSVKNYKGVKEITIQPEGSSLVLIAGGNGAGKSSFIDAITEIFTPGGTRQTPKPIREGETEAIAEVTTDTARIVRTWKKNDAGTLDAFALDGAKYPSGKQFVLAATGGAIVDPKEFVNLPEKDQREQLLARVELPFDLDELDRKRAGAYEERTDVGRQVKQLEGQLAGIPKPNAETPAEEVSAASIIAEYEAARAHNAGLDRKIEACGAADSEVERAEAEVTRLTDALDAAKTYAIRATETRDALYTAFRSGPERIDVDGISARLANAEQTNAAIREGQEYRKVAAALAAKQAEHDALEAKLATIDKTKRDGLAAAQFPIKGLSVDETGITFEGVPFRQVNTAMKTQIAFDLATQPQPDLRLIVIKDGDTLDDATLAGIGRVADERGYLVLTERDRDRDRQVSAHVVVDGALA